MADASSSIFNEQARNRLQSPDDLDRYVRVTSPSVWVVLGAVLALVLGLLAWGIFGSVTTSISAKAVNITDATICLLDADQAAKVSVGDEVYVDGQTTTVASITPIPYSRSELSDLLAADYLLETVMPGNWAYVVFFEDELDTPHDIPLTVSITTDRVAPISLILGQ